MAIKDYFEALNDRGTDASVHEGDGYRLLSFAQAVYPKERVDGKAIVTTSRDGFPDGDNDSSNSNYDAARCNNKSGIHGSIIREDVESRAMRANTPEW